MTIEIELSFLAVHQVLAPDYVGYPQQMVLHPRLEVQEGPDPVPIADPGVIGGHYPKCGPVAERWVFVGYIGLDPENGITGPEVPPLHTVPEVQALLRIAVPVGTGQRRVLVPLEGGLIAPADVSCAHTNQLLRDLVIHRKTFAGDHHFVRNGVQPPTVFKVPVVGLQHGALVHRVGIVKAEDEPSPVHLNIFGVDDYAPGAPQGRRTVRVRGEPHDDPLLGPL